MSASRPETRSSSPKTVISTTPSAPPTERSCLFLGYNLRDWSAGALFRTLGVTEFQQLQVLLTQPSDVEIALRRERLVEIIDLPLNDYVGELTHCLSDLDVTQVFG